MQKPSRKRSAAIDLSDSPELDASFFKRATRAKYLARVASSSNVVRIDPELTKDFPNEAAVNEALRLVQQLRLVLKTKTGNRIA